MSCAVSRTLFALVVLVGLHSGKGSGTGSELVRELALVMLFAVVHILVRPLGFVWLGVSMAFTCMANGVVLGYRRLCRSGRALVHASSKESWTYSSPKPLFI
jgi:hypothetical protein